MNKKEIDKEFIANPVEAYEKLKAENARLKEENEKLNKMTGIFLQDFVRNIARHCKR